MYISLKIFLTSWLPFCCKFLLYRFLTTLYNWGVWLSHVVHGSCYLFLFRVNLYRSTLTSCNFYCSIFDTLCPSFFSKRCFCTSNLTGVRKVVVVPTVLCSLVIEVSQHPFTLFSVYGTIHGIWKISVPFYFWTIYIFWLSKKLVSVRRTYLMISCKRLFFFSV